MLPIGINSAIKYTTPNIKMKCVIIEQTCYW